MVELYSTAPACIGLYRSGDGFQAAEEQVNSVEKSAKIHGFELKRIKDFSLAGYKRIEDIVNDLAHMKADSLIVWRLDCLAPVFSDFESIVKFIVKLSDIQITFISVEDKIDSDDPASRLLSNLHRAWIELKRNRKIENARMSSIKARMNGSKTGPDKKRDDEKILQLHQQGLSIRKIAKETNFSPALIHQVLQKLTGKTQTNKKMVTDQSMEDV